MAQYIITYFGGKSPETPEESKRHFAEYQAWLVSLGDSAISPMNPIKGTQTISQDVHEVIVEQASKTRMSGYTIVKADTLDDALAMAKSCPFLAIGGTLEVGELIQR